MLCSRLLGALLLCGVVTSAPASRHERRKINAIKYGTPRQTSPRAKDNAKLAEVREPVVLLESGVTDSLPISSTAAAVPAAATATPVSEPSVAASGSAPFENIWRGLSVEEAVSVVDYLHKQEELNLTAASDAGAWDNQITVVDAIHPKKADAKAYLASKAGKPDRYAKATIMHGASVHPWIENIIVGPLPISNETTWKEDPYTTRSSPKMPMRAADDDLVYELIYEIFAGVQDIVFDLTGQVLNGSDADTAEAWGIDPLWYDDEVLTNWVTVWAFPESEFDSETLLPQGLFLKLDQTGRDPSKWSEQGWLWNDIYYENSKVFRAAWADNKVSKLARNKEYDVDGVPWTGTDKPLDRDLPGDNAPPPVAIAPGGTRYSVDEENSFVTWQDWSLYWTFSRDTGMRYFDIRFRNTTIVYELGLEEALAHYAGQDPVQSGIGYIDSFYGFGPYTFSLIPGFDCPAYASFHNSTFHAGEISTTHTNAICMFEFTESFPVAHHTTSSYASSTKNTVFIIRTISTVGNYDYQSSLTLFVDGSIETQVRASGYIQSAYYANNDGYGYQIKDGLSGSMHSHALTYKVDLDINGEANSLAKHSVIATEKAYPWSNGKTRSTFELQRSYIETEDNSKINWPENAQSMYIVENKEDVNPYGEPRGYRIFPNSMATHLPLQKSSNLKNAQSFATHHLYATKHHDNEQHCSSALNNYGVEDPLIDFSKYFNGESLVQDDIVLWVTIGMHHVPHTGDLPTTVFTTAASSFMLAPHNYFLNDVSRYSKQQVRISYNSSSEDKIVTDIHYFNQTQAAGAYNLATVDLSTYAGDVNIRKFPYDPTPYGDTESIV